MGKTTTKTVNLLELKPRRNLSWQTNDNDRIVLLVPKFRSRLARKWVVPRLPKPDIRVTLDAFGSYVWQRCDGETTVEEIGRQMAEHFNEQLEPLYDRIGIFLRRLVKDRFLILDPSHTPS